MKKFIPIVLGRYLNISAHFFPEHTGKIGFKMFCYPFRAALKPFHLKFLNTAEKTTLSFQNERVQLYRWGTGPRVVLFVHGWQSHSYRWKNYVEALPKDQFSVYAVDAPGHGMSTGNFLTVPRYASLLHQIILSLGQIHTIVGHSVGAFSILYAIHQAPLIPVGKVILMAPPGEASDFLSFYQSQLQLGRKTVQHITEHFEKVIEHPIEYFSAEAFAQSMTQDGLIIHDRGDQETPCKYAEAIHRGWRKSKLILTEGLGHNLKSPEVVEQVTEFITKEALAAHGVLERR